MFASQPVDLGRFAGTRSGATEFSRYSEVANGQGEECLRACREMTDALYEGLDVEREIRAVEVQN
jgi:hypothetical protein